MTRHGYVDDLDPLELGRWRGRVMSAIRGRRGQRLLRDLRDALDALPEQRLVRGVLQTADGDYCALGAVCRLKGLDYEPPDDDFDEEYSLNGALASDLDIAQCLVREIEFFNDDGGRVVETPEERWTRMREWVTRHLAKEVNR